MFETKVLVIAGVEAAVLLLVLCVALLIYVRGLRRLVMALEAKVTGLRQTVKSVRSDAIAARRELVELHKAQIGATHDYGRLVEEQVAATLEYHRQRDPSQELTLDGARLMPADRKTAVLRHAFLNAEREAWSATDGQGIDWVLLGERLGQIARFCEQNVLAEVVDGGSDDVLMLRSALESQRRDIEYLRQFKARYLDAEQQWREAGTEAERCRQELVLGVQALGVGSDVASLLDRYADIWKQFGEGFSVPPMLAPLEDGAGEISVGRRVIANQEEVYRLRNMAIDQHKMIVQLKQQLDSAQSVEEKDAVIAELRRQLERHERFLKESDLCSRQLEDELERLQRENESLRGGVPDGAEVIRLKQLVDDFTRQSCDMLSAVETLEKENASLRGRHTELEMRYRALQESAD